MPTALRRLQLRIERSCRTFDVSYPWWIATYSTLAGVALAIAAWLQRGGLDASPVMYLALLLGVWPLLLWIPTAWIAPPWVEVLTTTGAVCLFLTESASPDLAPLLFLMSVGEVAAMSRIWVALVLSVLPIAVVVGAGVSDRLDGTALYAIGIVLAADIGIALRWQMRALRAEQTNTAFAQERAILSERQRLAREVHDVVGHSLSINLLHVTAARHALQKHADIADAIESLSEAERIGRSAMSDLRRTVAVLAAGPGETQALPGVDDIAALVERSSDAGLNVSYSCEGTPSRVGAAVGLGLYRIAQESLGNVARHAPTANAVVALLENPAGVRLTVSNTLPAGGIEVAQGGTGIPGMAARAEQLGAELHAGPDAGSDARSDARHWVVDVLVPVPSGRAVESGVPA